MLIKFTGGGRGGGRHVAEYLTREEGRGHAPPEVVSGDMDRTRDLIDSIERQWSYTHGVLSFAPEDAPSEEEQRSAMDSFERLAFAGLDREQYDITWVRHTHTDSGRVELHFVTPRMELTSGKAMNIAPPNWEHTYAPLRDALNLTFGWARPDDPERARELTQAPERAQEGFRLREGREGVHEYLTSLVVAQSVTDRASMVQAIREVGLEVAREGKDYITVQDPESAERFRMKGRIYEKDWKFDRELDRAIAPARGITDSREREDTESRTRDAYDRYQEAVNRRASFNSERYIHHEPEHRQRSSELEVGQSVLVDRAVGDVDRRRGLIDLALDARGRNQGDDLGGLPDLSAGRENLPDRAEWQRGRDVPQQREHGGVRAPAARGVSEDERETDSLRARLVGTIRDAGSRLRERLGGFREYLGALGRVWEKRESGLRSVGAETDRSRAEASQADRSLGRANEAHRAMGDTLERVGAASERLAARAAEMIRDRQALERRTRGRDRGDEYGL